MARGPPARNKESCRRFILDEHFNQRLVKSRLLFNRTQIKREGDSAKLLNGRNRLDQVFSWFFQNQQSRLRLVRRLSDGGILASILSLPLIARVYDTSKSSEK